MSAEQDARDRLRQLFRSLESDVVDVDAQTTLLAGAVIECVVDWRSAAAGTWEQRVAGLEAALAEVLARKPI